MYVIVTSTYADSPGLAAAKPKHREYLATLPQLVAAGPLPGAKTPSAVLVFDVERQDDVAALLKNDPLARGGHIHAQTVQEWTITVGSIQTPSYRTKPLQQKDKRQDNGEQH